VTRFERQLLSFSSVLALAGTAALAEPQPTESPPAPGAPAAEVPAPAPEPAIAAAPPASPVKPAPHKAAQPLNVTYDKGIEFATADRVFTTKLSLRTQFRFESTRPLDPGSQFANRFFIARSRAQLEGNVFGEDNRYKLEFGLGDKGSFSYVKDIYIDKAIGSSWIRVGQWKRPFNRQEIVSDFASEFNERANTADYVGGGRDLGIAIHNDYEKSPAGLEWVFGVFNGFSGGADRPVLTTTCTAGMTAIACTTPAPLNYPADWGPTLVGRLGWNSEGMKGYSEADLEGGPLRYAVGVAYKLDLANFDQGKEASATDNLSHGLEADALIKVEGFDLELGAYMMKLKSASSTWGALAQAGYFVTPKHAQVAARFAIVPAANDRRQLEVRGAFNWYWEGHRWKWMTDVGMVKLTGHDPTTMAADDPDLQLRSTAQLLF